MTDRLYSENITINTHSSIRIAGSKVLYFDPFRITDAAHDADVVFVTHSHFDHFDPESIAKILKAGTAFVMPETMRKEADALKGLPGIDALHFLRPGDEPGPAVPGTAEVLLLRPEEDACFRGLGIHAVPAYNLPPKRFHPKENGWTGYLVTDRGVRYYVAGDTDAVPELRHISCDVCLVPAGGKYTMDAEEAAALVNTVCPRAAIPTHYGSVAGSREDGEVFRSLVRPPVDVFLLKGE